ncbi:hypothetical protein F5148DRAFT_814390 [Russula earlei]|uniref:Uncharacterized protein n=1 Tax=Russula earlei TaxID=71964 RepID=A0ACC0UBM5_9AGAM|nr:hypothetical protein F5148DRAFT_814390 [Russula earlei]
MASILEIFLKFLRICRLAGKNILSRWPVLMAFRVLRRMLCGWHRMWHRKPGTIQNAKSAEPSSPGKMRGPYLMSDGSAVVKECVVSASTVPASASDPSGDRFESRSATAEAPVPSSPTRHSVVDHPLAHTPYPTHFLYGGNPATQGSVSSVSISSIQSRASDRLAIITTNSRESLRDPVGQPSLPKAIHRQFGRGPDPSRSREQLSRSPSPASRPPSRPPTPHRSPRIVTTNLPSPVHSGGGRASPVIQPSAASSHSHEPLSPPPGHDHRRNQSWMVDVDVVNPSTESLPLPSSTTGPRQVTDEPLAIDTIHLSPASSIEESPPGSPPLSPTASSIPDFFLPEGRFLQLIHSDQVPRYTKDITIAREQKPYDIPPLTTAFPYTETGVPDQGSDRQDCAPWIPATHPDGALYFYDRERRLFTDTDMHNPELREEIEHFHLYLQNILLVDQLTIPSTNYDLVLDIMPAPDKRIQWSYYYACHETRCLFWLDTYDGIYMISELDGVDSPAHVKHRQEALYWNHWSLFPAISGDRYPPEYIYDELMGILAHGCIDLMTSKSSTFPYDDVTIQKMIKLVQKAKGTYREFRRDDTLPSSEAKGAVEHYTAGTTRLLSFFAHWRFLHFHGQRHARLVRDKTVYDKPKHDRTLLITLLSPWLFLAPEVHLREMEKLWTDGVIIETVWKGFMNNLLAEWNGIILWSTVMLAVNVGFLAIPGVMFYNINGGTLESVHQLVILPSSAQIASSLSVEASVGSIVIGLLLARYNRTKQEADPSEASEYLDDSSRRMFGLESLAIMFSLPWAFLMWSMVTFSVALLLFCFVVSNIWTRVFMSLMSAAAICFTIGCIWTTWESNNDGGVWLDGVQPSVTHALEQSNASLQGLVARIRSFAHHVVRSLRGHLGSRAADDVGNVHPSTPPVGV